jgi:ATP-binding cassette subfamily C (CFTR/MRP) protein 4
MRADLYILDDPLSAVDPRVARHLFDQVICGVLRGKPRILVTHQLQFVRHCDRVLVLEGGRMVALDRPSVVLDEAGEDQTKSSGFLAELRDYARMPEDVDVDLEHLPQVVVEQDTADTSMDLNQPPPAHALHLSATAQSAMTINSRSSELGQLDRKLSSLNDDEDEEEKLAGKPDASKLHEEDQAYGHTPLSIYWEFFRFGASTWMICLMLILMTGGQVAMVFSDWWLARWTNTPAEQQTDWYRGHVYIGLVATVCVLALCRSATFFWMLLNASRWAFRAMLHAILLAPIQFFHVNPHGRILNRFSKDQSNVDELLPMTFFDAAQCMFIILGAIVIVCITNPYVIISLPFVLTGFLVLRWLYMNASRQVKRIESVTRSPVYSQLSGKSN